MPTFVIPSLRGGLNTTDPPIALADDQVVEALNVEFARSMVGERRRGATDINVSGSNLATAVEIIWVFRHLPTADPADAQLWVAYRTGGGSIGLVYKDTSWHDVTVLDAITIGSQTEYQIEGVSLHGKLFLFYNSAVNRLHVYDPRTSTTALRRVGMTALSTAPTAVESGSGSFASTRYYRTRETVQVSGATILRSEPSAVLTFAPSGSGSGATVTKPATVNSDPAATHWELEASLDNANFYRIATTVIGTSTAVDTTAAATGYAQSFPLSEDIGDYTPPHSAKFGIADDDRLLIFSGWEDEAVTALAAWTPPANATGVGNDERIPLDPVSTVNLDGRWGGAITDVAETPGQVWAFKHEHIYRGTRTGIRTRAYEWTAVSHTSGAMPKSACEGLDAFGHPAVYFADAAVGPCLIGRQGIQRCGQDIWATWKTVVLDGSALVSNAEPSPCLTLYYPESNQVHWWVGIDTSGDRLSGVVFSNRRLVLQVNEMRLEGDGWRRGWAMWDGPSATATAACLFAQNIDANTTRSRILRPVIAAGSTTLWRLDTGVTDDGTAYTARLVTKPYAPTHLETQFEVKAATVVAEAEDGAQIDVSAIPNMTNVVTKAAGTIDFTPSGSESHVIRRLDDLAIADLETVQVQIADIETPTARWALGRVTFSYTAGQGAGG